MLLQNALNRMRLEHSLNLGWNDIHDAISSDVEQNGKSHSGLQVLCPMGSNAWATQLADCGNRLDEDSNFPLISKENTRHYAGTWIDMGDFYVCQSGSPI